MTVGGGMTAATLVTALRELAPALVDDGPLDPAIDRLRWFPLPAEVLCELQGRVAPTHCGFQLGAEQ